MLKNSIITVIMILASFIISNAQNQIEALRYSQQFYSTTAKSDAMGNALSAVGADMSAFTINPAGIGVYTSSQFTFTPNFILSNTEGNYLGNIRNESRFGFNISNIGFVAAMPLNGLVKNVNLGITWNSTNDFRQRTVVSAPDQENSIMDFIVYNANIDRYSTFREDLAWRGWLLNYDDVAGEYWSFITDEPNYTGITQTKEIKTRGGMGELDFSIGANIGDMLYLGSTLAMTSVNYKEVSTLTERDFPPIYAESNAVPGEFILVNPDVIEYEQTLYTNATGFCAKAGMIFQPVKFMRIGAAIHSPTYMEFSDEYRTNMYIEYPVEDQYGYNSYQPDTANLFDWMLTTPFRANAGIAFILDSYPLGKFYSVPMTFSFDYEFVDYSQARLSNSVYSDYSFIVENQDITDIYKETHNFRAGAEVNLGKIKFRGGYALYTSPYASDTDLFKNAKSVYSGGIGFASEHSYLDLSYSYSPVSSTLWLYNANNIYPEDPMGMMTEPSAQVQNNKQFFKVTMGLRF